MTCADGVCLDQRGVACPRFVQHQWFDAGMSRLVPAPLSGAKPDNKRPVKFSKPHRSVCAVREPGRGLLFVCTGQCEERKGTQADQQPISHGPFEHVFEIQTLLVLFAATTGFRLALALRQDFALTFG